MAVRIRVARSELICCTPSLAKMAVRAAKMADNRAQENQLRLIVMTLRERDA
ncbi:hypothetical protein D3C76_1672510 [compost metagenome]